jgi:hypothetical protein
MDSRPAVGTLGRTLGRLSPSGQVEVLGTTHPARTAGEPIDAGRDILITGFDPFGLLVREATPAEVTPPPPSPPPQVEGPSWGSVLMVALFVLAGCFGLLTLISAALNAEFAFSHGAVAVVAWLLGLLGGITVVTVLLALAELLRLVARREPPAPR